MAETAANAAAVLEAAGDAIVTVGPTAVITSWNRHAQSLFGYPQTDAAGQSLALMIPEQYRQRHVAGFHAALSSGTLRHEGRPVHVEATTKDGEEISIGMTLALLRDCDEITSVVAVLRPVGDPEPFA
jgi:PAS domain S-box-containing protein